MRSASRAQLVTEPCNRVNRPRIVQGKGHGPAQHLRLLKAESVRLGFVNSRTLGVDEVSQTAKLASYVQQLAKRQIRACGLAESRLPGDGQRPIPGGWHLLWSGASPSKPRQHGVGLLLDPDRYRCLIDWSAVSERIMVARLRCSNEINPALVVAYAPTDMPENRPTKDAFYMQLHSTITALPSRDLLVLMGDFNAQVGTDPTPHDGVIGPHGFGKEDPSDNGERLLQLAAAFKLRLANTFFKHKRDHTATHVLHRAGNEVVLRVIDYFAVSKRLMSSVTDCRVFRGFDAASDHHLLVLTLRLRLSAAKQQGAPGIASGRYNVARLQRCKPAQVEFEMDLHNRFSTLADAPQQLPDPETEWARLKEAAQQAAATAIGSQPRQRERTFALSPNTLKVVDRKHDAHAAYLSKPCASTKAAYRACNNAAKRAVQRDQERYYKQQALHAERAFQCGNLAVFHKHVQRVFGPAGGSRSSTEPQCILGGADGNQLLQSREAIIKRFAEHFAQVLNCPADLDPAMLQTLEGLVQQIEQGQGPQQQADDAAEPPSLQEVVDAVFHLRNGAAPGADGIAAPMLKLSATLITWLHRVITAVWASGHAPVEWKRALLVALYKGKGDRRVSDNFRGISLLSIPGKVYALVIMARISGHIDAQLSDCQSAFRKGRGLTDSLFTIRMIMSKCVEFGQPLHMAFVDLRKAYDSVPRDAPWRVLMVYGVHKKLVELLEDLHTGTQAAVRMGGGLSEWFDVQSGVRQGCVIAPLLFNIYIDFVVKQALARMPEGCGVELAYHCDGQLHRVKYGVASCMELVSVLMYADDMVLLSKDAEELAVMLQTMDKVSAGLGMRINASKTEIMSLAAANAQQVAAPVVQISEGEVKQVSSFKYLGSMLDESGKLDRELSTRKGRALARFKQFERLWGAKHLSLATKVRCYRAYVLPILLFGSETWALSKKQTLVLERVHTSCLREMLGVKLSDRHTNAQIRAQCGIVSLANILTAYRLRWLGHVGRMERGRLPHVALFSSLHNVRKRAKRGRPPLRWEDCVSADLKQLGISAEYWEAACQLRSAWRGRLRQLTHTGEVPRPSRPCIGRLRGRSASQHADCHSVPFDMGLGAGEPLLVPPSRPRRSLQ